jgi:hypothetical protein
MGIEINPFSLFYFFGFMPPTGFIFTLTFAQTSVIIKGITSKQADSILHFQKQFINGKMIKNQQIELKNIEYNRYSLGKKMGLKEMMVNMWKFLNRNNGESIYFQALND